MLAYSQYRHVNHYKPSLFPNIVRWSKTKKLLKLTNSYTEYEQSRNTKNAIPNKENANANGNSPNDDILFSVFKI